LFQNRHGYGKVFLHKVIRPELENASRSQNQAETAA
jgi:hypothetical protein